MKNGGRENTGNDFVSNSFFLVSNLLLSALFSILYSWSASFILSAFVMQTSALSFTSSNSFLLIFWIFLSHCFAFWNIHCIYFLSLQMSWLHMKNGGEKLSPLSSIHTGRVASRCRIFLWLVFFIMQICGEMFGDVLFEKEKRKCGEV